MFVEDLDDFLVDFGVRCSAGGVSFSGVLDMPDEQLTFGGSTVQSTMYALAIKTSDAQAAGLVDGSAITVDGTPYVVRDALLLDDGAFTRLNLSK